MLLYQCLALEYWLNFFVFITLYLFSSYLDLEFNQLTEFSFHIVKGNKNQLLIINKLEPWK